MNANIKLKILSGNKIILAECLGYEAELFVPVIVNNRIVLQNAVSTRLYCNKDSISLRTRKPLENSNTNGKQLETLSNLQLKQAISTAVEADTTTKQSKENVNSEIEMDICPTRTSTPTAGMNMQSEPTIETLRMCKQKNIPNKIARIVPIKPIKVKQSCTESSNQVQSYPSPDVVRRAVVQHANESVSVPGYTPQAGLKIVRLHRFSTPNASKNLAKIVSPKTYLRNRSSPRVLRNLSNVSSFGTPPTLLRTNIDSSNCRSPNLARTIKTPGSVTKWRKCITPQKTYRRSNEQKTSNKTELQPLRLGKNGKLIENYQLNPTLPLKLKKPLIFKKRKLVVDMHLKITPKKFKSQLMNTEDLKRNNHQLPKSRRHFVISHMTAFDLLTNSGFYPRIGKEINSVFRQGCVNKRSATILKYMPLIKDIPAPEIL